MQNAKHSPGRDPLARYQELVREHSALVAPRLEQIRRSVDQALDEVHRLEREHLKERRRALSSLQARLRRDARFVLRSVKFAVFAERLGQGASRLPVWLGAPLPQDPASWLAGALPFPVGVVASSLVQEQGYEEEHDCIRDLLAIELQVGPLRLRATLERSQRSLLGATSEVPLVYQHQELSFQLEEQLRPLGLGDPSTRSFALEIAALALYAAPILLESPAGTSFSYP